MSFPCSTIRGSPTDPANCHSLPFFLGFLFLGLFLFTFFSIFLFRYLHYLYRNAVRRRNAARRTSVGSAAAVRSCGLDGIVIAGFPVYMFRAGGSPGRSMPECAICLAEFADGELCRLVVSCGHEFHVSCIDQWFLQHNTCPLCRSKLDGVVPTEKSFMRPEWCRPGERVSPEVSEVDRDEDDEVGVVVEAGQDRPMPSDHAGEASEDGGGTGEEWMRQVECTLYNMRGNAMV